MPLVGPAVLLPVNAAARQVRAAGTLLAQPGASRDSGGDRVWVYRVSV